LDLLTARNVLFVSFLDPEGRSLALASRDPEFEWDSLAPLRNNAQALTEVHRRSSRVLGDYLAVVSPVVNLPATQSATTDAVPPPADLQLHRGRLLGYVVIGLSQSREQALLRGIHVLIAGLGVVMILLSLPR